MPTFKATAAVRCVYRVSHETLVEGIKDIMALDAFSYTREFKSTDLKERLANSRRIQDRHPNRVPVIVDGGNAVVLSKNKMLVPHNQCGSWLIHHIRCQANLEAKEGLFVFIGNQLITPSKDMGSIYKEHKDEDGFLYAKVNRENAFG